MQIMKARQFLFCNHGNSVLQYSAILMTVIMQFSGKKINISSILMKKPIDFGLFRVILISSQNHCF